MERVCTTGELAAICGNLARGCEKQYKEEQASLYRELAAYFDGKTEAPEDFSGQAIAEQLKKDLEEYKHTNEVCAANGDRGGQRVCVWGEKVTTMLSFLADKYLVNGDKIPEGQEVWVCTVCGFVFVGANPPEICPVCKVPDWKFEKTERRAGA